MYKIQIPHPPTSKKKKKKKKKTLDRVSVITKRNMSPALAKGGSMHLCDA